MFAPPTKPLPKRKRPYTTGLRFATGTIYPGPVLLASLSWRADGGDAVPTGVSNARY
jgi:hypothetical protein